ncbi:hypothetical protein DUNSADRAFT_14532 [Dunaliella salina]|uniref:Encoded protein n=1 Tax=Dunaliella salina TaxID=3046 RepID=A0ABQ7G784_DUNSA|nr:hypothetical protein DUNSADRAFT_14532 [Dunaliella salina]|eukprot:KAF5830475.1 hypothetical protein DUNSADRAFT_14532 [Dunaliella salina]
MGLPTAGCQNLHHLLLSVFPHDCAGGIMCLQPKNERRSPVTSAKDSRKIAVVDVIRNQLTAWSYINHHWVGTRS